MEKVFDLSDKDFKRLKEEFIDKIYSVKSFLSRVRENKSTAHMLDEIRNFLIGQRTLLLEFAPQIYTRAVKTDESWKILYFEDLFGEEIEFLTDEEINSALNELERLVLNLGGK